MNFPSRPLMPFEIDRMVRENPEEVKRREESFWKKKKDEESNLKSKENFINSVNKCKELLGLHDYKFELKADGVIVKA